MPDSGRVRPAYRGLLRSNTSGNEAPPWRQLLERPAGNFELAASPGLLIKDSYWRWPQRELAGNAIDFFVRVLGLSFHDAMRQITGP